MLVSQLFYNFSIDQMGNQRIKFQHKISFKNDRVPLKLKTTPTIAITARVQKDGKILKLYKNCQKFYINIVLPGIDQLSPNNEFKNFFHHHQSFKDFNRVLFWKIMSVNSLFNLKKLKNRKLLYYLRIERRMVLVLMWLKFIMKLKKNNIKNNTQALFKPVYKFIITQKETNEIFKLKLKLYKLRLVRG